MKNRQVKLPAVVFIAAVLTAAWEIFLWVIWYQDIPLLGNRAGLPVNQVFLWGIYGGDEVPLKNPIGVAVARNGYAFVADSENQRVQAFYPNGRFAFSFGKPGREKGEFDYPAGIAVAGKRVYVSEINNHRIQVFNLQGKYLKQFPADPGLVKAPTALAADKRGRIYVIDKASQSVLVFNGDGKFLRRLGGANGGLNLRFPMGLAVTSEGNVVLADSGNALLLLLGPDGSVLKELDSKQDGDPFLLPRGLAADAYGRLYVADSFTHRVLQLNGQLEPVKSFGGMGEQNYQFYYPDGLAYMRGKLYVADKGNNRVTVYAVNE